MVDWIFLFKLLASVLIGSLVREIALTLSDTLGVDWLLANWLGTMSAAAVFLFAYPSHLTLSGNHGSNVAVRFFICFIVVLLSCLVLLLKLITH